jgi:hypothetical protein
VCRNRFFRAVFADDKVDVAELAGFEKSSEVVSQRAPRKSRQLKSEHFARPLVVVDSAAKDEHLSSMLNNFFIFSEAAAK